MNGSRAVFLLCAAFAAAAPPGAIASSDPAGAAGELAGLWEAKRRLGPDVRGPLRVEERGTEWRAEIAGRSTSVRVTGDTVAFELPDDHGAFTGRFEAGRSRIAGFWAQPKTPGLGSRFASPVTLSRAGAHAWVGGVSPLDDRMTFYLKVAPKPDGSLGAFLRNPERNAGRFLAVDHVEREGERVRLVGKPGEGGKGDVLAEGTLRSGTLSMPLRGGTFDFERVTPGRASDFYPRGRPSAPYAYAPPPAARDGWPVASVEDVGISREAIERFVRMIIETPIDSVHASDIHGVLIARHGKLVLEEYFHGEDRDKPHDTRSASKSLTSTLAGAAMHAGIPIKASTPVYAVMNGGSFPRDLEPRKRALTLEHLLTMSSGLDCDDRDSASPGNEDVMQGQDREPDYYRYTLNLKTLRDPGENAVYCSVNANLVGGVLARAAGRPLTELFARLIASPLQIGRYYMNLTPTGDAYMGGGVRFLPRDFMKLGQLLLNGGTWNGRRVLGQNWVRRATSPLVALGETRYGYLWWVTEYPYRGRRVRAFFAGGNGGQVVMGVPELDLLIAFYGGNYSDPVLFVPQREWVPKYILPAVEEPGKGKRETGNERPTGARRPRHSTVN
ncbi:MAG: beta-lactamase family protein [Acidobacteriota bacterium]|nr:beta-lactamase family protein [Acidobacteriota bacterium]